MVELSKKVIVALIPVLVFLAAFECGFEWLLNHSQLFQFSPQNIFRSYYMEHDRRIVIYEPGCGRYDPKLTYTFQPGVCSFRNREYSVSFMNNSLGLRDDEKSLHAPGIIVLGDSHAAGWGVDQETSFPQQIERATGISVLNAAIPSYGTAREMQLLEKLDTRHLQYLIIQYCNNDVTENKSYIEHHGALPISSEATFNEGRRQALASRQYFPLKYSLYTAQFIRQKLGELINQEQDDKSMFSAEKTLNRERRNAQRFLRILGEANALPTNTRILVIDINGIGTSDKDFNTGLRELLANPPPNLASLAKRIQVVDLPLRDHQDYFALDDHINASGHAVVARALVKSIQAQP